MLNNVFNGIMLSNGRAIYRDQNSFDGNPICLIST